jgi:hypothetical protein
MGPAPIAHRYLDHGQPVTLTSPTATTLANVQAVPNPCPRDAPGGVQFPVGFFAFQVQGLTAEGSTMVTLTLPPGVTVNSYYRYGPTADNPTPHWYPFLFDGTTGAEIDNTNHRSVLHFVDCQRGDDGLAANGVVVDAGAPGYVSTLRVTVPTSTSANHVTFTPGLASLFTFTTTSFLTPALNQSVTPADGHDLYRQCRKRRHPGPFLGRGPKGPPLDRRRQ